jgi:hypothetical protein
MNCDIRNISEVKSRVLKCTPKDTASLPPRSPFRLTHQILLMFTTILAVFLAKMKMEAVYFFETLKTFFTKKKARHNPE